MKFNLQQWKRILGRAIIASLVAVVVPSARAAEPADAPAQIKSVFEAPTKPGYTDPFFPRTQRLTVNKRTEAAPAPAVAPAPSTLAINQLVVRSIILGKEKTAQINNRILAEGESGTVSLAKGSAQVHVLEIRPRSVVIKIDNDPEPREIYLRPF